jgi:hypothetical protein
MGHAGGQDLDSDPAFAAWLLLPGRVTEPGVADRRAVVFDHVVLEAVVDGVVGPGVAQRIGSRGLVGQDLRDQVGYELGVSGAGRPECQQWR